VERKRGCNCVYKAYYRVRIQSGRSQKLAKKADFLLHHPIEHTVTPWCCTANLL
jgi:hypothetical protein